MLAVSPLMPPEAILEYWFAAIWAVYFAVLCFYVMLIAVTVKNTAATHMCLGLAICFLVLCELVLLKEDSRTVRTF